MWTYMDICGYIYMEIYGNIWKYVEICGNMWIYTEISALMTRTDLDWIPRLQPGLVHQS